MKPPSSLDSVHTRALSSVFLLVLLICASQARGQTPLDLDSNPSFDLGSDPPSDPLFTPELLGLTSGQPGFASTDALRDFVEHVGATFPAGLEVFVAYWGNPGYAVLPGTPQRPAPLATGSPMSLASAFRPPAAPGQADVPGRGLVPLGVVPGRTASSMYAEPTLVSLGGATYELPAPLTYVSPLVVDLDGDGILSASRGLWLPHPSKLTGPYARFDLDGDGHLDVTEWLQPGDGLLTTSSLPQNGRDLVGTAGGWPDGFAHLRKVFDLDQNGRVEGAELDGLRIWRDANMNAVAEAGEVLPAQSLGLTWISTVHTNYQSAFSGGDGMGGIVWDWWPNYALALRRAPTPAGTGLPMVGLDAMAAIRDILFGRVVDDNSPPRTASLPGPIHIAPEQLTTLGLDLGDIGTPHGTFRITSLADGGRVVLGYDARGAASGPPDRARLIRLSGKYENGLIDLDAASLPFEEIYQVACNSSGRIALVLGDRGSKLALVDFDTGTVTPPEGLDLRPIGLRGSGLAGDPMVRYSGTGNFWFSGWQLNEQGEVIDERVWAITPWGFCGGLSLTTLRNELGQLRSYFVTDATSGFFAAPTPGGTNETLWWVNGTNRLAVAQADSFGGMHAVSLAAWNGAGAEPGSHQVTYTWRTGETYGWDYWQTGCTSGSDTCHVAIATSSVPYCYPFLTDGGGTAISARLNAIDRTYDYEVWATRPGNTNVDTINTFPGQGRVTLGALAHYGTNGIDLLPMSDPAPAPPAPAWNFSLLPGSQLTDICPICGRPPIIAPMRGTFGLRLIQENPLFATYALENILLEAGEPPGATYTVRGSGVYHLGGEVGLLQDVSLEVWIDNGFTNYLCYLTNASPQVTRGWPLLQITLDQTNGTDLLQYRLELTAAPARETWFSTVHGFTPGTDPASNRYVNAGDLVTSTGRVVKRNQDLISNLGLMPSPDPPDLGLDALDILPGGEVAFSLEQDAFSQTLGALQHGDLLSSRGRVLARNQELTSAFVIQPPVPDVGLDAVQVLDTGEILFSVETEVFSGTAGLLRPGDLLSNKGRVVKNREELLARFHPPPIPTDFGLDAFHVWPSGEVWFSLEGGFRDDVLGDLWPGDLLSDRGELLYRNRDLLREFQPLEELADFGLDALFVVSDATAWPAPPRCITLRAASEGQDIALNFEGPGRVFQLEKATRVLGPWLPFGPLGLELEFTDLGALTNNAQAFYRLRQW